MEVSIISGEDFESTANFAKKNQAWIFAILRADHSDFTGEQKIHVLNTL